MLIDSHAHLEAIDNLEDALLRAKEAGVEKIICVGTSIETSKKSLDVAQLATKSGVSVYASVGIHPQDGKDEVQELGLSECLKSLTKLAGSSKEVIAIGECGLDYYEQETGNNKQETTDEEKTFQRELFEGQIKLAAELNLPLVIHCRNGWEEIFEIIQSSGKRLRAKGPASTRSRSSTRGGVFHSWTGDWTAAQKALDLDFYISFSGIVTFKNAREIQEVAKKMPLDRMLVETDSPFLAPEPFRGKTNEPKNVRIVAQFLASLRGLSFAKIASATAINAEELFGV